jgi:hypothetical protein
MSQSIMYVSFEENTGKILGIGPKPQEKNSLSVKLEEVLGILEGKESKRNYRVEFNGKKKQLELVHQFMKSFDGSDVNDFIYEIPENLSSAPDILVEHNIPETCWKINLGDQLKNNLASNRIRLNQTLYFAVTKKHDPNILYKTLSVDFSQTLRDNYSIIPFTMPFEKTSTPISVFTAKTFGSYKFQRVLNDE